MNRIERISVAIRHSSALSRADWLWPRVRPLYDRVLRASYGKRGLERVINGSDRILLSPCSRHFVSEEYEPRVWRRLMREIGRGDIVVEVGASIGIYTLAIAGRSRAAGHVFAFEPDPESALELEANVAINGWNDRVTVTRAAVGDQSGVVYFADALGMESHVIAGAAPPSAAAIRVPMVMLDDVFADRKLDILKIDVEGFEEPVIRGARRLLSDPARRPRLILIEVHPFAWGRVGTTRDSLLEILTCHDYRVRTLEGESIEHIDEYGHIIADID